MMSKIPKTFSIFPVNGKIPAIKWHEYTTRLPTVAEKDDWSKKYKEFGIATGPISKVLVLDDDGSSELKDKFIPRTWSQHTPRGGRHYFFKWIPELNNKVTTKTGILNKVDIRGQGGYVRFYGFIQPYTIVPLALPPKWLIDLLPDRIKPDPNKVWSEVEGRVVDILPNKDQTPGMLGTGEVRESVKLLDEITEGNRNDSFTRLAGSLRSKGYNETEIFDLLRAKSEEVGFPLNELKTICTSVARYDPKNKVIDLNQDEDSFTSFMADRKKIHFIVDQYIPENTITILAGLPESRKSWILLDLAIAISLGSPWMTKYKTARKKVLIIDQERPKEEMQRRFEALLLSRNISFKEIEGNLIPKVRTTIRINLERSFTAFNSYLADKKPDVVLIDSLKTFQTGDINSNQHMQEVFEKIKELRNNHNITFIILHHENKGAYARSREGTEVTAENIAGAAVINEVPENLLVSVSETDSSRLYHVKNNYGVKQLPVLVRVEDLNEEKTKIQVTAY